MEDLIWTSRDTWVVVIGALVAAACALPGCFLVLRKLSMMGDAISHAVLPGLAIAFFVSGSRSSFAMFLGAAIIGVLTAVFTHWVSSFGKVDRGASMGIVFTTMFALGLLLIVRAAEHVPDLDPSCVLYGAIEFAPAHVLFTLNLGGMTVDVPHAAATLGAVLLLNLAVVLLLFKELRISAFDPALGTTLGVSAGVMHYLLMTLTAVTVVAAFEAVGSIVVIAMLVAPPAAAYLLTRRLSVMLVLSVILGVASAGMGHGMAITLPRLIGFEATSTAGMMAVAAGLLFLAAWLGAPEDGLIVRWLRRGPRRDGARAPAPAMEEAQAPPSG